jgi:ribose transport system ATP-binding protein
MAAVGSDNTASTVLSLRDITKRFGATRALQGIDLEFYQGEVHCLIGENGAGKSTLAKLLSGVERPDSGAIVMWGRSYERFSPHQAIELGVSTVYQEADLVSSVSVAENVFLGSETTKGLIVDWRSMRQKTGDLATRMGVTVEPRATVMGLSPMKKQVVQILRAVRREARVLILDEPTSSLGAGEKEALYTLVRRLATDGLAIIYVSHFLDEVFEVGDRVTVLKDGCKMGTHDVATTSVSELVREMVGREESAFFARERTTQPGEVALKVEHYSGPGVVDASFEVRRGEIFGLGGLAGAGRTELANLIFGVAKRTSGRLVLSGRDVTPMSPAQAIARGICMLTEDRQGTGLLAKQSVSQNIAAARNERGRFWVRGERALAARMIERLRIVAGSPRQLVSALSGGNQQKVLLARWLAVEGTEVFILDEPTKGVDIGAKHEIYRLIERLVAERKMILLISSDLPELISLSDRVGVMREGRLVKVAAVTDVSEESLAKEFLGA